MDFLHAHVSLHVEGISCAVQVEEDEPSDFVRFDKFQPVMTKIMTERRYRPSTEEQLLKAFEVSILAYAAQQP